MAEKQVTIRIVGDASKAKGAFSEVEIAAGKTESKLGGVAKIAGGFVVAQALTGLGSTLMDGAKGAAEDEAAMLRLKTAVENTGASYDDYSSQIDDAIAKGQDLAFTDGETAEALSLLTSLTGDSDEALRRLSTAQDLARGTGMDLQTASKLLGRVTDENISVLSRYGIQVDKNATAQDLLNTVDQKFAGQAGTFAESDAGKMLKAEQAMGELAESAGTFLLPMLTLAAGAMTAFATAAGTVFEFLQPVTSLIGDNLLPIFIALSPLLGAAAVVIGGALVAAFGAWAAATWAQVAAALGLNAAMLPWIAALAAIGVAVAALYVAWDTNFLGIRDITQQVIDFILPYIETAMKAIQTAFETAMGVIQTVIETVWPIISTIVTTYIGILKKEIELALSAVQTIWGIVFPAIQAVVETVFPIIATVATTYINILKTEIELAINAVKWVFDNVFVPIQGVVSDVMGTIASLVTTGAGTVKTVIGEMLTEWNRVWGAVKATIDTLWSGATGAISLISGGLQTAKDAFFGIYDTFRGFAQSMVDGFMGPLNSFIGKVQGIIDGILGQLDRIPSWLRPGSPSRTMFELGQGMVDGLTLGIDSRMGALSSVVGGVNAALASVGGGGNGFSAQGGTSPFASELAFGDALSFLTPTGKGSYFIQASDLAAAFPGQFGPNAPDAAMNWAGLLGAAGATSTTSTSAASNGAANANMNAGMFGAWADPAFLSQFPGMTPDQIMEELARRRAVIAAGSGGGGTTNGAAALPSAASANETRGGDSEISRFLAAFDKRMDRLEATIERAVERGTARAWGGLS